MKQTLLSAAAFAALATFLSASPAAADAIDGHWCSQDGRRVHIDGPRMVTPGGKRITGDYDRHNFRYTVPAGEKGAGGKVRMTQQSEQIVHVWPSGGSMEVWRRCKKGVS